MGCNISIKKLHILCAFISNFFMHVLQNLTVSSSTVFCTP